VNKLLTILSRGAVQRSYLCVSFTDVCFQFPNDYGGVMRARLPPESTGFGSKQGVLGW